MVDDVHDLSPALSATPAAVAGAHAHIADCFPVLDVEQEHASHDAAVHKSNRGSLAIKEGNGMGRSLY